MDYTKLKSRVTSLINRYSDIPISLTRTDVTGYTKRYDPATDTDKWYYGGEEVSAPTATTYTGTCIQSSQERSMIGKEYKHTNMLVFITNDIPKPISNEVITVDGTDYTVFRVVSVNPGGTEVLYKIYVKV